MPLTFSQEQEREIRERVASGSYDSADAVVSEALQLLRVRDSNLDRLRKMISDAEDEVARGETIPSEEVFAEIYSRAQSTEYNNGQT